MALVQIDHITKHYDPDLVLDDISWAIHAKDRIGLIGANGTGKTTLLEIIAGIQKDFSGKVQHSRNLGIGYLSQEPQLPVDVPLREEMLRVFEHLKALEKRIDEASEAMADPGGDMDAALERYSRLQDEYEREGGYLYEYRVESVLGGLGFDKSDFDLPIGVLSGGQKSRAVLSKLLLEEPDLLLLDEPTNHLDIRAIEWLENFLNVEYKGAVVIVSHDRYFLNKVTQKTVDLRRHQIYEYRGNYEKYVETYRQERLTQERQYRQQQHLIEHNEEFIRRNMAGQRTREAQGRQKHLDRLERIERPDADPRSFRLHFTPDVRGGNDILQAQKLSKSYGDKEIFRDVTFEVYRRDVVGILGPNGSGKTTLFRMMLGQEDATGGMLRMGQNLHLGYYDQEHEGLNRENSLVEEILEMRPTWTQEQIRNFLGRFLFSGDEVFKRVEELSGGQQSRMMLAKLLLQNANVLLMDEPTNHLDIPAREALEQALVEYPATIFLISHDRYFLDKLANKVLVFEDGSTKLWIGNYSSYEEQKLAKEQAKKEAAEQAKKQARPAPPPKKKPQSKKGKKRKKKKAATPRAYHI